MAKRKGVSLSVGRGEKSKKGGLTAKGRAKYNRATGSNLQHLLLKRIQLVKEQQEENLFVLV